MSGISSLSVTEYVFVPVMIGILGRVLPFDAKRDDENI